MKTPMQKLCAAALVAAALTAGAVGVNAQTIVSINYNNTNTGTNSFTTGTNGVAGVVGTSSDIWNQVESQGYAYNGTSTFTSLVNAAGTATPIGYQMSGATILAYQANGSGGSNYDGSAVMASDITTVGTQTDIFTGLSSYTGDTFTLVAYYSDPSGPQGGTTFTINSGATGLNTNGLNASGGYYAIAGGSGKSYVTYTGSLTGANLSVAASGATFGIDSGYQLDIASVPEPAGVALAAVGGLALVLAYRRRRSA